MAHFGHWSEPLLRCSGSGRRRASLPCRHAGRTAVPGRVRPAGLTACEKGNRFSASGTYQCGPVRARGGGHVGPRRHADRRWPRTQAPAAPRGADRAGRSGPGDPLRARADAHLPRLPGHGPQGHRRTRRRRTAAAHPRAGHVRPPPAAGDPTAPGLVQPGHASARPDPVHPSDLDRTGRAACRGRRRARPCARRAGMARPAGPAGRQRAGRARGRLVPGRAARRPRSPGHRRRVVVRDSRRRLRAMGRPRQSRPCGERRPGPTSRVPSPPP